MGVLFICKHTFMLKSKLKVDYWLTVFVQSKERRFTASNVQGVSENTDTFLSLPALVFITPQTSLGARFDA